MAWRVSQVCGGRKVWCGTQPRTGTVMMMMMMRSMEMEILLAVRIWCLGHHMKEISALRSSPGSRKKKEFLPRLRIKNGSDRTTSRPTLWISELPSRLRV